MDDSCPKCGATYQQGGDPDEGYVRSICECELANKCFKCKRGAYLPINQARLDLDGEVRHYACAKHGHMEAEGFEPPAAPIGAKPRAAANAPKATFVEVVTPLTKPRPAPQSSNERSGMEIKEHVWTVSKWSETKRAVMEDMKDPRNKYDVTCTQPECGFTHSYAKRKIEADDDKHSLKVVCPKCGWNGYRIV